MIKSFIEYELSIPLSYAYNGEFTEGKLLKLKAPTLKTAQQLNPIRSIAMHALTSWQMEFITTKLATAKKVDGEAEASASEITASNESKFTKELVSAIIFRQNKHVELFEAFKKALPVVAEFVDTGEPVRMSMFENVKEGEQVEALEQFENLMFEYCAVFFLK
jgi:hypothetical protein